MKVYRRPESPYYYVDLRPWGLGKLSTGQTTVSAAKQIALEYIAKKGRVEINRSTPITLANLIERYLAYTHTNKTFQCYVRDKALLKLFLEHSGDKQLRLILPEMIEVFKTIRLQSVKASTINRDLNSIRAMFTKAVDWRFLKESPCNSVKKLRVPESLPKFYSHEEIRALLAVSPQPFKNIWLFFLYTGMRRGEVLNLNWSDIKDGIIYIRNPKEGREKTIPVFSELQTLLSAMGQPSEGKVVPIESTRLTKTFNKLAKTAGIGGNLHRLRHTVATHLLAKGVGVNIVQKLLGHASLRTTNNYTKALETSLKKDLEKLKW